MENPQFRLPINGGHELSKPRPTQKNAPWKPLTLHHYPFRITGDGKTRGKFSMKSIVFKIRLIHMRTEVETTVFP